jgi:hypothetical protein
MHQMRDVPGGAPFFRVAVISVEGQACGVDDRVSACGQDLITQV